MITNTGKNIIAKYLLNQAPEFASHIAVGVGGNAISQSSSVTFLENAKSLNFEVTRVPILSKGLIRENDVEKIVFKAQLPTDQRIQITEIGLYPAESNALAERYDSKIISTFTNSETWVYSRFGSASVVPIASPNGDIPINTNGDINEALINLEKFSFVNSDSPAFEFSNRKDRNEQPRYLSKSLLVFGNTASIDSNFNYSASSYYVENSALNINMGNNLPTDEIKLAFSVLSRDINENSAPSGGVRFVINFINNIPGSPSASAGVSVPYSTINSGRYNVATVNISDFSSDPNFSWSNINTVRIYSSVIDANPEDYFISLDAMKIENISTVNPLYGLVAAEYIETPDEYPVLKRENSISYIEYRFGLGVSSG